MRSDVATPEARRGCAVRFYRDGDEEAMVSLLEAAFGRWPAFEITVPPTEHLRWKLRSEAYRHHVVAEVEGRIAGMSLLLARPAKVGARSLVQRLSVDLCVHPDYQRSGVLKAMRDMRDEAFRHAFDFYIGGMSRHPAVVGVRAGQQDRLPIGNRVQVRERAFTPRAALTRHGPRGLLAMLRGAAPRRATPWAVRETDAFDERVDALWEEASGSFDFIAERTTAFLNWRYCDRRSGRFTCLVAEEGERLLGYAVAQVSHARGLLSDLLVVPERLDVAASLAAAAADVLRREGVEVALAWSPTRHPYNETLDRQGFRVRPTRTRKLAYVALSRCGDELRVLQDPRARLHLTVGDQDVV